MKFLVYLCTMTLFLYGQEAEVRSYTYYVDASNTWKVEDAYIHKNDFSPVTRKDKSLGFKEGTVWIYVKVKNRTNAPTHNVIVFPYPQHDTLTVYRYTKGILHTSYVTGDLHHFDTREVNAHYFAIPYVIQAHNTKELLFKIKSNSSLNISMDFYSKNAYDKFAYKDSLFLGIYYSVVFLIILYNLILYVIIKHKVYLHYVLFHLSYFFLHFTMNGLSFEFLYPAHPWLNLYVVPIFFILSNYLSILFTITYLELEKYEKKLLFYLLWLMRAFMGLLLVSFFLPYALVSQAMMVMAMVSIIILISIAIYMYYKHRSTSVKIFILAWGVLLLGAAINVAQNFGFIPINIFTNYSAQIGALIELSLLSVTLAYNYNVLLLHSKQRASELQELTQNLENKVMQRTHEIAHKNERLHIEIRNKNVLFKELHHRTKNNLQIVSSLLSMQAMEVKEPTAKNILLEMTNRIKAIAFIHEKLYKSNDLTHIDMQAYTESLVLELQQGLHAEALPFIISCDKIKFNIEISVPLGIIINELVTNAVKHAFTPHAINRTISIKLKNIDRDIYILKISDNGMGADIASIKKGFGFQIVHSIVHHQLSGNIKSSNNNGVEHTITFSTKGEI